MTVGWKFECFLCGAWREKSGAKSAEAWQDDSNWKKVEICERCERKIVDEGPRRVMRGDEVFIVRVIEEAHSERESA